MILRNGSEASSTLRQKEHPKRDYIYHSKKFEKTNTSREVMLVD